MKSSVAAMAMALAAPAALAHPSPAHVAEAPVKRAGPAGRECHCCSELVSHEQLKDKVFIEADGYYGFRLDQYYSANAAQAPWCMVFPTSTQDVSAITNILVENGCPFGMRSGAHSAFKGSNGIDKGVTVDFGWMNTTTYDEEAKVASVQPGSDWGRVYDTLDPYGVVAVGGRADVVGVGGFTTGGGYSFHSNSRGFACDNIVNFEVVLADGSVVDANAAENADLYTGLKGGSGNLGFVTRLDTEVVESTMMWGGISTYDIALRDDVFRAYLDFADNMARDPASQQIVAVLYGRATGLYMTSILSNVDANQNASAFQNYFGLETTSTTLRVGPVAELVPEFTGPTPLGLFPNWFAGMTTNDFAALDLMATLLEEYIAKMKAAAPESDFSVIFQLQPVTQSIVEHGRRLGGNVLGLDDVVAAGPTVMWLFALTCDTAEAQDVILPIGQEFRRRVYRETAAQGTAVDWNFLNYSWEDQDPISLYGDASIQRLRAASAKYDPDGVFQTLRRTGFHLPT